MAFAGQAAARADATVPQEMFNVRAPAINLGFELDTSGHSEHPHRPLVKRVLRVSMGIVYLILYPKCNS